MEYYSRRESSIRDFNEYKNNKMFNKRFLTVCFLFIKINKIVRAIILFLNIRKLNSSQQNLRIAIQRFRGLFPEKF